MHGKLFSIGRFVLKQAGILFCLMAVVTLGHLPSVLSPNALSLLGSAQAGELDALKRFNKGAMRFFVLNSERKPLRNISFNGPDEQPHRLSDWKGRVVLINLWATWCIPCRREMPALNDLQAKVGDKDFEVVAINLDKGSLDKSRKFLQEYGIDNLRLYSDPTNKVARHLKAFGLPVTILVDREGRELGWYAGEMEWSSQDAVDLMEGAKALD